jgi:hypothetical protein
MDRANVEVETLLKVVLVLVIVWIGLEIIQEVLGMFAWLLRPIGPLIGLVVAVLIALWLLDRL